MAASTLTDGYWSINLDPSFLACKVQHTQYTLLFYNYECLNKGHLLIVLSRLARYSKEQKLNIIFEMTLGHVMVWIFLEIGTFIIFQKKSLGQKTFWTFAWNSNFLLAFFWRNHFSFWIPINPKLTWKKFIRYPFFWYSWLWKSSVSTACMHWLVVQFATVYIKNICISTNVSQVIEFVLWVVKIS